MTEASPSTTSMETSGLPRLDIRQRIADIDDLPSLPEMATQILKLRDDADATVEQLVGIVQLDPAMAALVIRYANSPLYGHNNVDSLHDAIFRVLGFETVLFLALGSTLAQTFRLPDKGPLGMQRFWRNAVFSAALVQKLANLHGRRWNMKPGSAYLCALLHNMGYLVLATLFHSEYFWLNKVLDTRPDSPVIEIESQLLGITHAELGVVLADIWRLPAEVCVVIGEHHNLAYQGEYANTVKLVQITDQLLRSHQMSDADSDEISPLLCEQLALDDSEVYLALDDVLESSNTLDSMAKSFNA